MQRPCLLENNNRDSTCKYDNNNINNCADDNDDTVDHESIRWRRRSNNNSRLQHCDRLAASDGGAGDNRRANL